jgi:hypothetical protein
MFNGTIKITNHEKDNYKPFGVNYGLLVLLVLPG